MTLEACYQKIGGDYQDVWMRIPSEALIKRFVDSFLKDPSFDELCSAAESGDRAAAFRAAHTLKGVCGNLSFCKLQQSSSRLTEALRPETAVISEEAYPLLEEVRRDYLDTTDAIRSFLEEAGI